MAPFAYVTNTGSRTISVIDITNNTVAVTSPLEGGPLRLAMTPDRKRAYITSRDGPAGSGIVSVLDTTTQTVTASVPQVTDFFISGIAITRDGKRAYVASAGNDHTLKVFDTATNRVTSEIALDNSIDIAVTADGKHAWVTTFQGVTLIDTHSNTVAATIDIPKGSTSTTGRGLAFSPDGRRAYVTTGGLNKLTVIDTATRTVTASVAVGTDPVGVAVTPDGRRVYVTNHGSGNVSVVDTRTNTVSATVAVGAEPFGVAITADGKRVYVTCPGESSKNVRVIDAATNAVVAEITAQARPFAIAINDRAHAA
ncbi:MAG: cytochrome D1 domain-containing protein [Parvibaculaceae bacterium]